jgi:ribosome-associated protein
MPSIPFTLNPAELEFSAMRSQGTGGQNVNKVASAIHLRFDIGASSLPEALKTRLFAHGDQRITADGVIVIKSQEHRNQEQNRTDAIERLEELLKLVAFTPKKRKKTQPTKGSQERRLVGKTKRGAVKKMRGKMDL